MARRLLLDQPTLRALRGSYRDHEAVGARNPNHFSFKEHE